MSSAPVVKFLVSLLGLQIGFVQVSAAPADADVEIHGLEIRSANIGLHCGDIQFEKCNGQYRKSLKCCMNTDKCDNWGECKCASTHCCSGKTVKPSSDKHREETHSSDPSMYRHCGDPDVRSDKCGGNFKTGKRCCRKTGKCKGYALLKCSSSHCCSGKVSGVNDVTQDCNGLCHLQPKPDNRPTSQEVVPIVDATISPLAADVMSVVVSTLDSPFPTPTLDAVTIDTVDVPVAYTAPSVQTLIATTAADLSSASPVAPFSDSAEPFPTDPTGFPSSTDSSIDPSIAKLVDSFSDSSVATSADSTMASSIEASVALLTDTPVASATDALLPTLSGTQVTHISTLKDNELTHMWSDITKVVEPHLEAMKQDLKDQLTALATQVAGESITELQNLSQDIQNLTTADVVSPNDHGQSVLSQMINDIKRVGGAHLHNMTDAAKQELIKTVTSIAGNAINHMQNIGQEIAALPLRKSGIQSSDSTVASSTDLPVASLSSTPMASSSKALAASTDTPLATFGDIPMGSLNSLTIASGAPITHVSTMKDNELTHMWYDISKVVGPHLEAMKQDLKEQLTALAAQLAGESVTELQNLSQDIQNLTIADVTSPNSHGVSVLTQMINVIKRIGGAHMQNMTDKAKQELVTTVSSIAGKVITHLQNIGQEVANLPLRN